MSKDVIHGTTKVSRKTDLILWHPGWPGSREGASKRGAVVPGYRAESCLGKGVPGIIGTQVEMDKSIFSIKSIPLVGWAFLEGRLSLLSAQHPECAY